MIEAQAAIERLAAAPAEEGLVIREIWLLRLRADLQRAHGDGAGYREYRDRYRQMAETLGFEGISTGPRPCHDGGSSTPLLMAVGAAGPVGGCADDDDGLQRLISLLSSRRA
ncbi:MAG TPA: hypothetical protein VKA66_23775 [Mycobacterium sp.]|nr:hypothetical protein [Mycobacterium sp.]